MKDKTNLRLDKSSIKGKAKRTDAGFIFADSVLTRVGVFKYINNDGTVRNELRLPEEVFNVDSMETLKMIPATHGHPYADGGIVTPENASRLQKGHIGENVRQDGNDLMGTIMVTDKTTIDSINDGNKDISCGYSCDLEFTSGTYEGQKYDAIQRNIKYNHVAVGIPRGRAGNSKINLDCNTLMSVQILDEGAKMPDLKKINLDGVEYEAEAPVLTALNTIKNDNADLTEKLESVNKEKESLEAKLDTANDELSKRNDADDSEKINGLVEAKVVLLDKAKLVLDSVDITLSNSEIMKAVIKDVSPNVNLDEKSDDYIEARFDSVLELLDSKKENKKDSKKEFKQDEKVVTADQKRLDMIARDMNKYKGAK